MNVLGIVAKGVLHEARVLALVALLDLPDGEDGVDDARLSLSRLHREAVARVAGQHVHPVLDGSSDKVYNRMLQHFFS